MVNVRTANDYNRDGFDDILFGFDTDGERYLAIVWGGSFDSTDTISISRNSVVDQNGDSSGMVFDTFVRQHRQFCLCEITMFEKANPGQVPGILDRRARASRCSKMNTTTPTSFSPHGNQSLNGQLKKCETPKSTSLVAYTISSSSTRMKSSVLLGFPVLLCHSKIA